MTPPSSIDILSSSHGSRTGSLAVVELPSRSDAPGREGGAALGWVAVLVAVVLAASPLAIGFFDFSVWGPVALGAMVLLIVVAWGSTAALSRRGVVAAVGLTGLLALSAASILWAQSKESAWTDTNRLALYVVIFAIVLLAVRDRRTARLLVMILGLAALLTSVWFPLRFVFGGGSGAFLQHRLSSPIGYINGTAGLLVMGIWPWLGLAETAARRQLRAAAFGAAAVIAGTFVLTQSRAVVPATVLSVVLVLACAPGRTRRAVNLLLLAGSVGATLPWTLKVYSTGGLAARGFAPGSSLLRGAGAAILLGGLLAAALFLAVAWLADRVEPARRPGLSRSLGIALIAATILVLGGGIVAGRHYISRQYHAFTSLKVDESASVRFADASGFRYDLWRIAVREFRSHPLGGVGAGNYDRDYYQLRKNPQYIVQPHSLELQMLAELGIGGLLALLVFCGTVLAAGFARSGTLAADDLFIRLGALGVFGAWLADTSVDWLYDIPGLTGMAVVAAAILLLPARTGRPAASPLRPAPTQSRRILLVTGLALVALLAASVGRQYAATRYTASGSSDVAAHPRQAIDTLRTAARLDPYSLTILYKLAAAYSQLDEYPQARDALILAAQREPSNYVPPALLGDLALRRGDVQVAVAAYRRAAQLDPHDEQVMESLANAERARTG